MKVVKLGEELPYTIDKVWKIISDVTRCDWVPSVDSIVLEESIRRFTMEGIGEVHEKILINDPRTINYNTRLLKHPRLLIIILRPLNYKGLVITVYSNGLQR